MNRDTAVALKYERGLPAPFVVARGRGDLASKLTRLAEMHEVPLAENAELAEALYTVELGAFIPEPFFRAVAEILAVVLSAQRDRGSSESNKGQ